MQLLRTAIAVIATASLAACATLASKVGRRDKQAEARLAEAERLADDAETRCRMVKSEGASVAYVDKQIIEFEQLAVEAEQKDPDVWKRDQPIAGRARPEIRTRCPDEIRAARIAAQEREAKQRAREDARKARLAAMRGRLKGDRIRIFDSKGAPFEFEGAVESSPFWRYAGSVDNVHCSVIYKFKGDRIAKKEVARTCPDDPHAGIEP